MRFSVLGSGSKGNALIVEGGGAVVIVDAGYSPKEIKRRCEHLQLDIRRIDAILVSHGHGDHTKGAKQLAGGLGIPTYTTEETKRFCAGSGGLRNHVPIASQRRFSVKGLEILPVATPHDAPGSLCFVLDDGEERLGTCTDLGVPTEEVAAALSTCDSVLLEHNHDLDMLQHGPYSAALKRRIASSRGHLSNEQGARLLHMAHTEARARGAGARGMSRVILGHLSEVNNTPRIALAAARPIVDGADVDVAVAPQHHPTGWLRARMTAGTHTTRVALPPPSPPPSPPPPAPAPAEPPLPDVRHKALQRQLSLFATAGAAVRR